MNLVFCFFFLVLLLYDFCSPHLFRLEQARIWSWVWPRSVSLDFILGLDGQVDTDEGTVRIGAYETIALPPATTTMCYDDDDTNDNHNLPT